MALNFLQVAATEMIFLAPGTSLPAWAPQPHLILFLGISHLGFAFRYLKQLNWVMWLSKVNYEKKAKGTEAKCSIFIMFRLSKKKS